MQVGRGTVHQALHQLRAIPETFTGRAEQIEQVLAFVRGRAAQGGAVAITSGITGLGGIGKTELANVIAHALSADYSDAQLLLELGAKMREKRIYPMTFTGRYPDYLLRGCY